MPEGSPDFILDIFKNQYMISKKFINPGGKKI